MLTFSRSTQFQDRGWTITYSVMVLGVFIPLVRHDPDAVLLASMFLIFTGVACLTVRLTDLINDGSSESEQINGEGWGMGLGLIAAVAAYFLIP